MKEQFICEPIKPVSSTMDTRPMSLGEPGLPGKFIWREGEYAVDQVLEKWKETSNCTHGSRERYVRKHWFKIAL